MVVENKDVGIATVVLICIVMNVVLYLILYFISKVSQTHINHMHAMPFFTCMVSCPVGVKQRTVNTVGFDTANFDWIILDWGIQILRYCH